MNQEKTLKAFRMVAILEGWSYIAIFITMFFKYVLDMPLANYIVGSAHGALFILYMILLLVVVIQNKLTIKDFILGFVASLIPFGTFYADKKLFSKWEQDLSQQPNQKA